jgi:CRISPR-associated endonuclease Csn1
VKKILGLDLGTSSVGWALFEADDSGDPFKLIDLGVRHFEEVVDAKTKTPKNVKRRTARQMRKGYRRRRQRRDQLLAALREAGMAPPGDCPFAESAQGPDGSTLPYRLRAEGLQRVLTLEELGRALFHLGRRRGYKSNRGAKLAGLWDDPDVAALERTRKQTSEEEDEGLSDEERKEQGRTLEAIQALREQLGERSLGQFFWDEIQAGVRVRGRHTDREMYQQEFARLWTAQAQFYPHVLTEEARCRIEHALFFQRPLKIQKFLKTKCTLETKKPRAERAQSVAQRFRYWQDLANLAMIHAHTYERRELTLEERHVIAAVLEEQGSLSWAEVRKRLRPEFKLKEWEFNLARAKKSKGLTGNTTAARIRFRAEQLWVQLGELDRQVSANGGEPHHREQLVEILLTIPDRGQLYRTLRAKYDLTVVQARDLAVMELESGTAALSARAMRRILKFMEEGKSRTEAQVAAGYTPWSAEIEIVSRLPAAPGRLEIPNPRVRKGLGQVRKVVNALLRVYGAIDVVRIELARDLSLSKKERQGLEDTNKRRQKDNERATENLRLLGIEEPSRNDLIWWRLAEQCRWHCPYTGLPIPTAQASMGRFHIEHIVPFSVSWDDSFNNLTLCDAQTNVEKGNRTPWQAFGGDAERWQNMIARSETWTGPGSGHKRRLFQSDREPDRDKMVERQLNESKWICKAAAQYLKQICPDVQPTKGSATAMLRAHWRLMEALYGVNEKRRDDLRHHAVDAVAVAFTSRSIFQRVTAANKKMTPLSDELVPPAPGWLHGALKERLASMVVSHETTRHASGPLHDATRYGLRHPESRTFSHRKPLAAMSKDELSRIIDPGLRAKALLALLEHGGEPKAAFATGLQTGGHLCLSAKYEVPFPRARILSLPSANPTYHLVEGDIHHVAIFRNDEIKAYLAEFTTAREVSERIRRMGKSIPDRRPVIRGRKKRYHRRVGLSPVDASAPGEGWSFVMWLAKNDAVRVSGAERAIYTVAALEANDKRIALRPDVLAVPDRARELRKTFGSLPIVAKVEVSPIGVVREVREGVI